MSLSPEPDISVDELNSMRVSIELSCACSLVMSQWYCFVVNEKEKILIEWSPLQEAMRLLSVKMRRVFIWDLWDDGNVMVFVNEVIGLFMIDVVKKQRV